MGNTPAKPRENDGINIQLAGKSADAHKFIEKTVMKFIQSEHCCMHQGHWVDIDIFILALSSYCKTKRINPPSEHSMTVSFFKTYICNYFTTNNVNGIKYVSIDERGVLVNIEVIRWPNI